MITYEFETVIKNGTIEIPEEFKGRRSGKFKVIIVMNDNKRERLKTALLNAPYWPDETIDEFNDDVEKGYKDWTLEKFWL